ncbi:hypothetical protein SMCF_8298, partial [Streptomyces coelicoflavus ZG0656]
MLPPGKTGPHAFGGARNAGIAGRCEACSIVLRDFSDAFHDGYHREGVTDVTPWQHTLRATGLVGALGIGAVVSPYGAEPAHAAGGAGTAYTAVAAP